MPWDAWIAYLLTVLVLMSTPGPSHLLMLSNSMAHGFGRSLATAAGDLFANVLQMLAAGLGLATLILASESAFTVIKWLGVTYLVWLGGRMIYRSHTAGAAQASYPAATRRRLWLQGFVTSAANPKAVVFFAALFPQFIDPERTFWIQLSILSATYVAIDGCFLIAYGAGADWISKQLKGAARGWLDRIGGAFLIGAAVLLGLRTIQRT